MKIIKCDNEEIIRKAYSCFNDIEEYFEDKDVFLFLCLDADKLSFVGMSESEDLNGSRECLYLDGDRKIPFSVDRSLKLEKICRNGTVLSFGKDGIATYYDESGICHTFEGCPPGYGDFTDDILTHTQYSGKQDVYCEIRHRSNSFVSGGRRVYDCVWRNEVGSIFIKIDYAKNKHKVVSGSYDHYELFKFDSKSYYYLMTAVLEYGFINVLSNGSNSLSKALNNIRKRGFFEAMRRGAYECLGVNVVSTYYKPSYISIFGKLFETSLLSMIGYSEEDVKNEIEKLGFKSDIPEPLLSLYYGNDDADINKLETIIDLIKDVIRDKDNTRYMVLQKKLNKL